MGDGTGVGSAVGTLVAWGVKVGDGMSVGAIVGGGVLVRVGVGCDVLIQNGVGERVAVGPGEGEGYRVAVGPVEGVTDWKGTGVSEGGGPTGVTKEVAVSSTAGGGDVPGVFPTEVAGQKVARTVLGG